MVLPEKHKPARVTRQRCLATLAGVVDPSLSCGEESMGPGVERTSISWPRGCDWSRRLLDRLPGDEHRSCVLAGEVPSCGPARSGEPGAADAALGLFDRDRLVFRRGTPPSREGVVRHVGLVQGRWLVPLILIRHFYSLSAVLSRVAQ